MTFCPRCGTKLRDNGLFCGICGRKSTDEDLIDKTLGYTENHTKDIEDIQSPAKSINPENSISITNIIKSILTKPITSINRLVDMLHTKDIIILSLVLAIIQGFFAIWSFRQILFIVSKTFTNFTSYFADISIHNLGGTIYPPYGRIFFHGFTLYFIIFSFLHLGICFIFNVIHKTKIDSVKMNKAIILSTIPFLGGELLFLITSYIDVTLGFTILLISIFIFFSTLLYSMRKLMKISENILLYNIAAIFTVMLVCFIITFYNFLVMDINSLNL